MPLSSSIKNTNFPVICNFSFSSNKILAYSFLRSNSNLLASHFTQFLFKLKLARERTFWLKLNASCYSGITNERNSARLCKFASFNLRGTVFQERAFQSSLSIIWPCAMAGLCWLYLVIYLSRSSNCAPFITYFYYILWILIIGKTFDTNSVKFQMHIRNELNTVNYTRSN